MLRKILLLTITLFMVSCGSSRKTASTAQERKVSVKGTAGVKPEVAEPVATKIGEPSESIVNTALTYTGVRYKFGGTDRKGMDCSGLLYVAFGEHDVSLPRVSYQMAEIGKRIRVEQVAKGDLLFFQTTKRGKRINHVGLVVAVEGDDIKFIHSTTSRGVIVSSLREGYWNYAFVKATRVL